MKPRKYFAAANGYNGFRSYFGSLFESRKYDAIYVLKGGPGTGKSSLMRKVADVLEQEGATVERIYCSSDPSSLDGIISELSGIRCAIIDGTAPHERDAIVAGAIDRIINLGDNWDEKWLRADREKILTLTEQKAAAYRTAYFYLSVSGKCRAGIYESTRKRANIISI